MSSDDTGIDPQPRKPGRLLDLPIVQARNPVDLVGTPTPSGVQPGPLAEAPVRLAGGRYEIVRYLDRGATASIYLAEDTHEHRMVVVKVLEPRAAASSELRRRFYAGARAAMRIHHPNVVRIYAISSDDAPRPYAVMEAMVGEPLHQSLRRCGALEVHMALAVARAVALGLQAVHEAGVVHRDVKPGNIFLLGPLGDPHSAKVVDFGLARVDAAEHSSDFVVGTAQYMAPEQVVGDPVDARTDIYSLGVVLFRMLTGQLPFDLDLSVELLRHQLSSPTPPPSWLVDDLDPFIDAIVLKAMRKHPANRFRSMSAFVEAIDSLGATRDEADLERLELNDLYAPQSPRAEQVVHSLSRIKRLAG